MDHAASYREAVSACEAATGRPVDPAWAAFLYLFTSLPGLWQVTRHRLDFGRRIIRIDPEADCGLSSSERLVLQVGLNLFRGRGQVDLAKIARYLDDARWAVFIDALRAYRAGTYPTAEPPERRARLPRPQQLASSQLYGRPELAALAILDASLDAVRAALHAQHPEFDPADEPAALPHPPSKACYVADSILVLADTIQDELDQYWSAQLGNQLALPYTAHADIPF